MSAAVASAIEEQIATTGELSRSASDASQFVGSVVESATAIKIASARAEQSGAAIDRSGQDAANLAAKLQTRFVTVHRCVELVRCEPQAHPPLLRGGTSALHRMTISATESCST